MHQIALGLSGIHRHNVLHLDLKPENVLVSPDGTLKIGDFGQARLKKDWKDGSEGDATYMAPELFQNSDDSPPTPAADIFSLGLLLFELATGLELPKEGPLWRELREGHAKQLFQRVFDERTGRATPMLYNNTAPNSNHTGSSSGAAAAAASAPAGTQTPRPPGAPQPFTVATPTASRSASPAFGTGAGSPLRPSSASTNSRPSTAPMTALSPTLENIILEMLSPKAELRPSAEAIIARIPRSMIPTPSTPSVSSVPMATN
jgi:serine/threonine protein kinase